MKVAVLSGKGGAGKTLVAVNLAAAAKQATYIDCDVEEPNGHLFWKPETITETAVSTLLPQFDAVKCTGCRKCVSFCRFHALMYVKGKPMVFPEVCHSCGGCALVCPEGAVSEVPKAIGLVRQGRRGETKVVTGVLNPGEASGVPVIRAALRCAQGFTVIDCPPGSACPVLESAQETDYCLLVVEPTAFGFHNFQMVYELVTLLGKGCGVIINKEDAPYPPLEDFCAAQGLPILLRLPYRGNYARMAAEGTILSQALPEVGELFASLYEQIGGEAT